MQSTRDIRSPSGGIGKGSGTAPLALLVVEGAAALRAVYQSVLTRAGHAVTAVATGHEALAVLASRLPDLILLDLKLPNENGLEVVSSIRSRYPDARIIVMASDGSVSLAVEAMRAGAHDFLVKPFDESRFLAAVESAVSSEHRPTRPVRHDHPSGPGDLFLGSSASMSRVFERIKSVAPSMASVFITGESGTGKELCAQAIHESSARAGGPFVPLNCGAIPQDLLESEVFGHVKGSFTGAIADKAGAAVAADGGTLFLDEICEMEIGLQTKLLRFLQTSTVQPVGATKPRKVNVRIICATNRDPMEEVRRGRFREDLYYRLYVVPIHMPPLRDRGNDVIEIAEAALARFAAEEGRQFDGLDDDVRTLFRRLHWPGNVRQLLNVIRNVVVLNSGGKVSLGMLPFEMVHDIETLPVEATPADPIRIEPGPDDLIGRPLAEIERLVIEATISRYGGSVPKAARVLDVSPSTLYRKLESWSGRKG
ncbi:sigma-54 dependent transcriptional regulator [Tabrizicola sp. J26]|uniref:sigma-54-dependent transcriptional regulator n=1 Tax=Alitabrizicola rongguiensis TaxID=2909234 RepID=UPI001F254B1F|nr:sigma-54 dependent transcriptional regulator [Tabrizicola rongguiensis]MCF1707421.1 sigma-54 dependent transcriptional regulator [Tabrizicola rongguiensis]